MPACCLLLGHTALRAETVSPSNVDFLDRQPVTDRSLTGEQSSLVISKQSAVNNHMTSLQFHLRRSSCQAHPTAKGAEMQLSSSSRQRLCSSRRLKEHRQHALSVQRRSLQHGHRLRASMAMDGAMPEDQPQEVCLTVGGANRPLLSC